MSDLLLENAVREAAHALLAAANLDKAPINVFQLAHCQGVRTSARNMQESGRLIGLRQFEIEYNSDHPETRQRFTICHELGHTFFIPRDERARSGLRIGLDVTPVIPMQREERLCDIAAAELLMPVPLFRGATPRLMPSLRAIELLAVAFNVSRRAVVNRIRDLQVAWDFVLVYWVPSFRHGSIEHFTISRVQTFGVMRRGLPLPGTCAALPGLFRTIRKRTLVRDTWGDWILQSRACFVGTQRGVLSVLTRCDQH